MNWIKAKLRTWLGITALEDTVKDLTDDLLRHRVVLERLDRWTENVVNIGVDVHFKSPHKIWIFTKIGGGQVREIDITLGSMRELTDLVKELEHRYRADIQMDTPPGELRRYFDGRLPPRKALTRPWIDLT